MIRRYRPGLTTLFVALMLGLYAALTLSASRRVGVTADEVVHLTAGYSYWKLNDYRLQPENGTLPMRIAALPLMALDLRWPPADDPWWRHALGNHVGDNFFFNLGNPLDRMLLAARTGIALLGAFTLWLIWRWTRGLFGTTAGFCALALAVFCPALLAHGALATSDMAITAALLAAVTAFWRLLHLVTWWRIALAILAGGAVLLAKMSGLLAAPMLALLLVFRWLRPAPLILRLGGSAHRLRRRGAIIAVTSALTVATAAASLGVVWGGYGFRFSAFSPAQVHDAQFYFSWPEILDETGLPDPDADGLASRLRGTWPTPHPTGATRLVAWMRDHRVLPEAYLWGLAHTYKFSRWRPAFLNGEFSFTGWPQFFPWAFLLKTSLPTLALLLAGLGALVAPIRGCRRRWLYRSAPLLMLFFIYWAFAVGSTLNIGHRHILPTYPVIYVFAGAATLWLTAVRLRRWVGLALSLTIAAHAADSWSTRPFYLSYFQPLAGGPEGGWRHLVDSSFDWGQGLPDLARWLEARAEKADRTPVYLTYFGADSARARKLDVIRFADDASDRGPRTYPVRPKGGWFAISATHFQRVYLRLQGPWESRYERLYQQTGQELAAMAKPGAAGNPTSQPQLLRAAMDYEVLTFGRIVHFLRDRKPDRVIGGSILLFRLTDAEVFFALNAPLARFPSPCYSP